MVAVNLSDPVDLAVLWARLQAVADEAGTVLMRTAFSSIVRESRDFSVVFTDPKGISFIQTTKGIGFFGPALGETVRAVLKVFPVEMWRPGDIVITNDPWICAGHTSDIALVRPIFLGQICQGFIIIAAHAPDIGGRIAPSDAREVYEEGIILPPSHLFNEGVPNTELFRLIEKNVRIHEQVLGDINASISCTQLCEDRLVALMGEYELANLTPVSQEILERSERSVRREISALPDGVYTNEVVSDGLNTPLKICAKITISGDRLAIDYAGSSDQVAAGINSVMNYTKSYSLYTLKCLLDPKGPNNDGFTRPITITAPPGSILNAEFPAPVYARSQTGHYLGSVILTALAPAAPHKVIAECGAPSNRTVFNGKKADGTPYSFLLFTSGGFGARSNKDGLSCTPFPSNTGGASVESIEAQTSLLILGKKLRAGSGGDGKYRGGCGLELQIKNAGADPIRLSVRMDRLSSPPEGLFGGSHGACADILLNGQQGIVPPKGSSELGAGDVLTIKTPGGGGYGAPEERSDQDRLNDREGGYVVTEPASKPSDSPLALKGGDHSGTTP